MVLHHSAAQQAQGQSHSMCSVSSYGHAVGVAGLRSNADQQACADESGSGLDVQTRGGVRIFAQASETLHRTDFGDRLLWPTGAEQLNNEVIGFEAEH